MAKYFSIEELSQSEVATAKGIDNTMPVALYDNANGLMGLLDFIRTRWGGPIEVSSGYRCKELNEAVGGSPTSAHPYALAADIQPMSGCFECFRQVVRAAVVDYEGGFDQLIIERRGSAKWVHIGWRHPDGRQRRQLFAISE